MKKRILMFIVAIICVFSLVACGEKDPVDPAKTDSGAYDVSKLYDAGGLELSKHVKEIKEEGGAWIVKTEFDIVSGTKMGLEVTFKNDKFEDVKMTITGTEKTKYEEALEVEVDTTPEPTEEVPEPEVAFVTKSNNPTLVKGENIRLPRGGQSGNETKNKFDFDTAPATGTANDHQKVGTAAFENLEYAVAAYRHVVAVKNVFGSYANFLEAESKAVAAAWKFDEDKLVKESAASAAVKVTKVYEFPLSYIVFASSSAPNQHDQRIEVMVRIKKGTNKVMEADYAFYHVSEYRNESHVTAYSTSLKNAKTAVKGVETTKVFAGKTITGEETTYDLDGVTNATLTNSTLVNAFNTAFAYYNANLKTAK